MLYLVGYMLEYYYDARTHERKILQNLNLQFTLVTMVRAPAINNL